MDRNFLNILIFIPTKNFQKKGDSLDNDDAEWKNAFLSFLFYEGEDIGTF